MSEADPAVRTWRTRGQVKAVVLVLHGGAEHSHARVAPWRLAYQRMVPLAKDVHRAGRRHGVEVRLLRNRVYGWNDRGTDALADARRALERIHEQHPDAPVILVGHSMGGRVALRVADDPAVVGVCALAPWTPPGESIDALGGRAVLIAHGTKDRMTDPVASHAFAERAEKVASRSARFEIGGEGHAMLRRSRVWNRLVRAFIFELIEAGGIDETLSGAWDRPSSERLRIPV
ncbi:alpha/beta fold hydrolase [Amycolatopsis sp. QT-25]|uniref:alpha/beta hydrolase n=1 Tax=Amycolatopsis sp. QT-25 TaxID=3034022 RepID=UPI0023EB71DA|nr:alpha/beta fold hydrolase [Amycolatopsis sp. QT-25]WET82214.1 alpha/beta fold hydrolase [Amycolatopsis sp. QT-25]